MSLHPFASASVYGSGGRRGAARKESPMTEQTMESKNDVRARAAAAGCCGPAEQAACCQPSAKAACCGVAEGEECGCR